MRQILWKHTNLSPSARYWCILRCCVAKDPALFNTYGRCRTPTVKVCIRVFCLTKINILPVRERKREADELAEVDGAKRLRLSVDQSEYGDNSPSEGANLQMEMDIPVGEVRKVDVSKGKGRQSAKASGPDNSFKEHPYTYVSEGDPVLQSCM